MSNNSIINIEMEEEEEIFQKIILPSYLEVFEKTKKTPKLQEIIDTIKYNLNAKALDVIYDKRDDYFTSSVVTRALNDNNCVYYVVEIGSVFNDNVSRMFSYLFNNSEHLLN